MSHLLLFEVTICDLKNSQLAPFSAVFVLRSQIATSRVSGAPKGAKYDSHGQVPSEARHVAPGK